MTWMMIEFLFAMTIFTTTSHAFLMPFTSNHGMAHHHSSSPPSPALLPLVPSFSSLSSLLSPSSSSSSLVAPSALWSLSVIGQEDHYSNVAMLAVTASLAQRLGRSTLLGKLLGAPVTAMALAFCLSSVDIVPPVPPFALPSLPSCWRTVLPPGGSTASSFLQSTSLTLATPLLLLGTNLRANYLLAKCGSLLASFGIATLGSLLGALAAMALPALQQGLRTAMPTGEGIKIAAALLAKNIGGGINYVAVCACLGASAESVAAGLCVDNVMALIYFPLASLLASNYQDLPASPAANNTHAHTRDNQVTHVTDATSVESLSLVFALTTLLTSCSRLINAQLRQYSLRMGAKTTLNLSLPIATLLTVLFSTFYPKHWFLSPSSNASHTGQILGTFLLYLFFATAGAPGWRLASSLQNSFIPILSFLLVLYTIHAAILYTAKLVIQTFFPQKSSSSSASSSASSSKVITFLHEIIQPQRLLVASSAAIGGPATAAALAQSHKWKSLLQPSLLVGNVGYAIATFIGLLFYGIFS